MVKTVLITRPEGGAAEFFAAIAVRLPGAFVPVFAALTAIRAVPAAIELGGISALIFTSANAARQFAERGGALGKPAYCVGQATAAAVLQAGMTPLAASADLESLERVILADSPAGRLLHLRGVHVAGDLAGRLRRHGLQAESIVIYDQPAVPMPAAVAQQLAEGRIDLATFFSPRAAALFAGANAGWQLRRATALCLSNEVAAQLRGTGFGRVVSCRAPTVENMLAELASLA